MHPDDLTLNDYVDNELPEEERSALERHMDACESCRTVVDGLRAVKHAAAELGPVDPPARVWSGLQNRIELDMTARGNPSASLAAAAVLLLATLVGLRFGPGRHIERPSPLNRIASTTSDDTTTFAWLVKEELEQSEEQYQSAINGLEAVATDQADALDEQTAETLRTNIAVIDQAISESRAAVTTDPTNVAAQKSLLDGLRTKVSLLQNAVAIITTLTKVSAKG